MPENQNELVLTNDGSYTLRSKLFNETFHSTNGALTESKHIFIRYGLQAVFEKNLKEISILELGFGTGLNALLTYEFALNNSFAINYHTIELYPLSFEETYSLPYREIIKNGKEVMQQLHISKWEIQNNLGKYFKLNKNKISFELYKPSIQFDLIYHDAFSPDTQEMYWNNPFIQQCYDWLNPGGVLVSYCAKGSFKRALKTAGFFVEGLEGPPGKREVTRAVKSFG